LPDSHNSRSILDDFRRYRDEIVDRFNSPGGARFDMKRDDAA
jgi:hypothetical protein